MHVYQMRSSVPSVVSASQERISVCMNALKAVSKVWLVAKMVHTLFESILGNKVLEERLQKAAGKRHQKTKSGPANPASKTQPAGKRKYDDMEFGYSSGPPAPQLSYERSRPQTPSLTPNRDLGQQQPSGIGGLSSPAMRNASEQFLPPAPSRNDTRPASPFPGGFSIPATPPDLFLVTRNSPPISQSLWENFQPDQLFPDGTNMSMFSSPNGNPVDPQLQMHQEMQPHQVIQSRDGGTSRFPGMASNIAIPQANMGMHAHGWSMDGMMSHGLEHQQDDNWSNSSRSVPIVPNTLNVEDW